MKTAVNFASFWGRVGLVLCLLAVLGVPAFAYDDPPMRVARLNFVQGSVSFQPAGESDWAWATLNRPMTAGDSLWTGNNSKAEMHIGSTAIRVGGQTSVSFLNLDDRTVQIQLNSGTINVRVRNLYRDDVLEVDTPNLAFTVLRQGDYRITVDPDGSFTTITLRDGQGQVTGGGQAFLVDGRSQVQVSGTDYISYDIYDLPGKDSFDQWAYTRQLREERSRSARYVSPELTGSEDLDLNGTWRTDRTYGPVWVPTRVSRDWAPYKQGHWAWVDPWGWTWVDDAPAGFVTSHYGRWAHVDRGYGGGAGGWVWVPPHREANRDVYAQRPVYSPALVTFVGDSNSSRDFGNSGGVAWVPLAPGEVYVPARQTSPTYVTNINVTNTVVKQTTITNVVNNNVQTNTYVNQNVVGAVTAVPRATFVNAQPVAQAAVRVSPSAITMAPAVHAAPVAPVRASVMGANKASTASAAFVSAPPKPPDAVVSRAIVAKVAPPPPPVAFAQKQQALQANPGKPLDAKAEQNLRAAAPPPVVRIVKTAPPPAVVKPVETVAKKPQPATSLNTAQQVHPPAPGAPPAAAASQTPQQLQAAEKVKQQAAQQLAVQQAAAAEKAKQEAAQQQAAQQVTAEKAKQEAAQKAKLEIAQQQAATDKAKQDAAQQQASAEKSKQQAAQQQAAQLASAEKTKQEAAQLQAAQQAAAGKAKQEAAQQQAAQQATAEKAKQEAAQKAKLEIAQQQAATDRAKQDAAQQQPSAEKSKQQAAQLAAAEKTKQEAAQQLASAEKAKQEAAQQQAAQQAAAEKSKQQAAQQQASQQAAAEKTKQQAAQQQLATEKAKQEAALQLAAQHAASEKAKQEADQQHAAQLQAVAEKTKQDAAQQVATQQAAVQKAKLEAAQQQATDRGRQQPPTGDRPPSNPNARPPNSPPSANQPPAANSGPVRIAENVQAAKLVSQPKLNYPPEAKAAHIAGTVRVQALIGTDGRVKTATVLSGPEPLHAAALENARQRRYQPTLLDGKPVEVETEISIPF